MAEEDTDGGKPDWLDQVHREERGPPDPGHIL